MIIRCRRCHSYSVDRWGLLTCDWCNSMNCYVVPDETD